MQGSSAGGFLLLVSRGLSLYLHFPVHPYTICILITQAVYEVGSVAGCSPYIRLMCTGDLHVLADAQGEGRGGEGGGGDEEGGEEGGGEEGEGGRQVYQAEDQALTPF